MPNGSENMENRRKLLENWIRVFLQESQHLQNEKKNVNDQINAKL